MSWRDNLIVWKQAEVIGRMADELGLAIHSTLIDEVL